jgi:predicted glycosyltransferase
MVLHFPDGVAETRRPKASVREAEIAILPGTIVAKRLEGAKDIDHLKLPKASKSINCDDYNIL